MTFLVQRSQSQFIQAYNSPPTRQLPVNREKDLKIGLMMSRYEQVEDPNQYNYSTLQGEAAAVLESIKAMSNCLEIGGCASVPGIPDNQYQLTLITSIFGGFVFGFSTTIQPQGDSAGHHGSPSWPLIA